MQVDGVPSARAKGRAHEEQRLRVRPGAHAAGYVTAVEGTNGFVCLVDRSWESSFHDPELWSPRLRAAVYIDAAALAVFGARLTFVRVILAGGLP